MALPVDQSAHGNSASQAFQRAIIIVLAHEGGYVNSPEDPGGATNLGVTKRTWEDWIGHSVNLDDMRALTGAKVSPLYHARYWDAVQGDTLPAGVDLIVFDEAVNQGPGRAVKSLQAALGVVADGSFGPQSKLALRGCDPARVIEAIAADREAHYRSLPTFDHFGPGWMARLTDIKAKSLAWASAAPRTLADAAVGNRSRIAP